MNERELFTKYKSSYRAALWDFSVQSLLVGIGLYLRSVPLLTLLNVKTFVIFHDCCHNSYIPSRTLNYVLSHITGMFVLTSPNWILDHHTHHLTNGNVDNKYNYKFNELVYTTKKQYDNWEPRQKQLYSFIHHPLVFFTLIPFLYSTFVQRFIYIYKKIKYNSKFDKSLALITIDHVINNIGSLFVCVVFYRLKVLLSLAISAVIAFLLFFNEHTFNPAYVVDNKDWNPKDSGIVGSSFIQIPRYLKYFFGGIEYHHIHHINAKIPGYNLQKYHEESGDVFKDVVKLSLSDCYNNMWFVMYDEDKHSYIKEKDIVK